MNAVLSKLWLWLWHLLPANPILVRVVYGASRRQRHLWLRFGYLAALAAVVLWLQIPSAQESASLTELAKSASLTFRYAATTQLLLMCFLAPVFTASAITQERDAQTFNILISTPLTSGQIVLGTLMSRLYFVIVLLLAGLPIFCMTMIYGGVTGRQIAQSFALSASTAVLTGALAIFIAMIGVGTRRTIFSFYLMIALYLLALFLMGRWDRTWVAASPPNLNGVRMSWLTPLHPFLALEVALNLINAPSYAALPEYGSLARYALAFPSSVYVIWTLLLSLALIFVSMYFVRRGIKTGEPTFFSGLASRFRRSRGEQTRQPRSVWSNPVAWREACTRASGGRVFRFGIVAAGLAASLIVFFYYLRGGLKAAEVPEWLAGLTMIQFALALIIAANTAATSITKEKESKTMELLMTTPLTSSYILWGKLRGLVSFVLPLLIGPVVALLLFATIDLIRGASRVTITIETAAEVGLLLVIYTAIACVIGLRFSLYSRTNVTAVMTSIGAILLGGGLVTLIGFALVNASGGEFAAFLSPFTPFTAVWYLVSPAELAQGSGVGQTAANLSDIRVAAAIGTAIALAIYALLVWRGYVALIRGFDMIMRKQTGN